MLIFKKYNRLHYFLHSNASPLAVVSHRAFVFAVVRRAALPLPLSRHVAPPPSPSRWVGDKLDGIKT